MLHVRLAQDGVSHGGRSSGRVCTCLSFLLFVSREVSLCERISSHWSWMAQWLRSSRGVHTMLTFAERLSFVLPRVSLGQSVVHVLGCREEHA